MGYGGEQRATVTCVRERWDPRGRPKHHLNIHLEPAARRRDRRCPRRMREASLLGAVEQAPYVVRHIVLAYKLDGGAAAHAGWRIDRLSKETCDHAAVCGAFGGSKAEGEEV